MDGERWLRSLSAGSVRMKVPPSLHEFGRWVRRLQPRGRRQRPGRARRPRTARCRVRVSMSGRNLHFDSGAIVSDRRSKVTSPAATTSCSWPAAQAQGVRRSDRMASVPGVTEKGVPAEIEIRPSQSNADDRERSFRRGANRRRTRWTRAARHPASGSTGRTSCCPSRWCARCRASWTSTGRELKIVGHTDNVAPPRAISTHPGDAQTVAKILADQRRRRSLHDGRHGGHQAIASNAKPEAARWPRRVRKQ